MPLPIAEIVVPEESATPMGYKSISMHANHGDMVTFASAEDIGFKRLLGELVRLGMGHCQHHPRQRRAIGGGGLSISAYWSLLYRNFAHLFT